ncbi:MAG: metallophosphoesterase [Candidatus Sericytochromatia bacterium]
MNLKKISFLSIFSFFLMSCSSQSKDIEILNNQESQININKSTKKIIAIGDIHGDLEAARTALKLGGLIDNSDNWIAKDVILVQTGDQIDRGDNDKEIIDLFEKIESQAPKFNSIVYQLNGNHEIMNASGDMRYVTEKAYESFNKLNIDTSNPLLKNIPDNKRKRYSAFLPTGLYAKKLAKRNTVLQIGDNIFVHGGLLPKHVEYGMDKINSDVKDWLNNGKTPIPPESVKAEDSVVWTRIYADEPKESDCDTLDKALKSASAKRLIVGHTVHPEGITSDCNGQVWRIDTGMSRAYTGRVELIEINGDSVRILKK